MSDNFKHFDSTTQLLESRVAALEEVIKQIQEEKNDKELLDFPWVGNLGQWYWMVPNNQVIFNEKKVTNLGYRMEDLPDLVGFDYFTEKLHPLDYERVMDNMKSHLMGLRDSYEVEYRIRAANGEYIWYYDRGKITKRDERGNVLLVSGIVFDINKNKQIERELKEANEKLNEMVNIDALTGAYNRRYILKYLEEVINRAKENKSSLSLIMIDVDHFKHINDEFGHSMGDHVLKNIVDLFMNEMSKIGEGEALCRWGGEEFIIVLPNKNIEESVIFAERLRAGLYNTAIDGVGTITASFGVSSIVSKDDDANILIKRADDLMYKSKQDGRNKVSY